MIISNRRLTESEAHYLLLLPRISASLLALVLVCLAVTDLTLVIGEFEHLLKLPFGHKLILGWVFFNFLMVCLVTRFVYQLRFTKPTALQYYVYVIGASLLMFGNLAIGYIALQYTH